MILKEIQDALFERQDTAYRDFHSKLIPNVDKNKVIGVRTPDVKLIAKRFLYDNRIEMFLNNLPHTYYEENNVHGFIICSFKDYEKTVEHLDLFLPFADNWATCDLLRPKVFASNKALLKSDIIKWISSDHIYTKRFGIEMAMVHFLESDFDESLVCFISEIRSDDYYVNMMISWYFATALAKQWNKVIPIIENNKLDVWTHNKTIQKAIESYRISEEQKLYLKGLK